MLDHSNFLRNVLLFDAATCVATGMLMAFGAAPVSVLTEIPASVLWFAGMSLFPIAVFIALVALEKIGLAGAVWLVILGNLAWVAGSLILLFGGGIAPNTLGTGFIVVQAFAVAVLAELEYLGVRRTVVAA